MFPERFKMPLCPCTGSPYRHEILETPMKTRKKAVMWTGEHGFLDVSNEIQYKATVLIVF